MSQPPQSPWWQPPSADQYGQQGYGQQGGVGHPSPGAPYGQPTPSSAYGQSSGNPGHGQSSANSGYGQDPQGFGQQPSFAPAYGTDGQQTFAQQSEPPKKSAKAPLLVCAGCAVLALLVIIAGTGIFLLTRDSGEPTDDRTTTAVETPAEESTGEETPSEETTSAETPSEEATSEDESTEAAGGGEGTKDAPYAIGETFTIDDGTAGTLDVTIGEVNWDATDSVMKANEFNEEPGEDETYILVPVTMTYHGDETAEPGFAITVDYVAETGNSFRDEGAVTSKSWIDVNTLHDGGTAEWELGIIVPKDQVKTGLFTVSALLDFTGDAVWVKAA